MKLLDGHTIPEMLPGNIYVGKLITDGTGKAYVNFSTLFDETRIIAFCGIVQDASTPGHTVAVDNKTVSSSGTQVVFAVYDTIGADTPAGIYLEYIIIVTDVAVGQTAQGNISQEKL